MKENLSVAMAPMKVTRLDALPAEILAQIVSLVPSQHDRNACSLASRSLKAAERATRTELKLRCSWEELESIPCCFRAVKTLGLEVPLRSINESDEEVKELRLGGETARRLAAGFPNVAVLSLPGDVKLPETLVLDFGKVWPHVRWVTGLQLGEGAGCAAVLRAFPELKEVHFHRVQPSDLLPACREVGFYNWQSLEKLSCVVDASTFLEVVPKCSELRRIDLHSTKDFRIDVDKLSAVFHNCTKLERLGLDAGGDDRYKPLLTSGAFDVLSSCPNMTSLKVTEQVSCGKPLNKSLVEVLANTERVIPLVRTLCLDCGSTKRCQGEGNMLGPRVMKFTSLTELTLTLCRTDQTMLQVVEGCPVLQKLSLIHSMSRDDFESLVTSLGQAPKLTDLSLEHYYDKLTLKEILECIDCLKPKLENLRLHCAQSNRGKGPLAPPMQGWPVLRKMSITCFIGTGDAAFNEDWFTDCPNLVEVSLGFQACDEIDIDTDTRESIVGDTSQGQKEHPIPPDKMGSGFVKNILSTVECFELQGHTGWPDAEISQVLQELQTAPRLRELDIDDFCPCYLQHDTWLTTSAAETVASFPVLEKVWVGSGDLEDVHVDPSRQEAFQILNKSRSLHEIGIVMSGREYHRHLLAEFNRSRMKVMEGHM